MMLTPQCRELLRGPNFAVITTIELLVLDDVAAVLEQERADRGDDAGTFLAAQREGERVGRGCLLSTRRC